MNPVVFAMRHPVTVIVALAGLVVGSGLALLRMRVDIFPNLNLPVIYVVQPYGGMDPAQMEGLLTFHYENHFLYISGIHHVESRNIQGFAQMKIFFHPGTDMVQAMAETVAYVNRARSFMPPGTVAPFVVRFDTGSVPVGYLVLESQTKSIDEIQEAAYIRVRPALVSLPGVSAPPPFGGNQRTIVVHVDPDRLRSYRLAPDNVVAALSAGNVISPSGNARIQDLMPLVPINAMVIQPEELANIPIKPGQNVYLRDLATVEDGSDIRTSFALVNGRRAVYMMVSKRAEASTLTVVNSVKANLPKMQAALPEDIKLRFEFDQSPYVTRAIAGVASEGALGAVLTGLMVLVFLRDWRSVLVVVLNIPFALLGAVVALWLCGQTLNLMTLGGLALAVGILVDEATVAVENIHTHLEKQGSLALAVWHGTMETAVPRLLAMLCILAVFIPSFFMQGAARELFVPLSLAVGFSMVTSYFLSSTFVPVLAVWLLRKTEDGGSRVEDRGSRIATTGFSILYPLSSILEFRLPSFDRLRQGYARFLRAVVLRYRRLLLPLYALGAGLVIVLAGGRRGTEIFPFVDSGQFQLRLRAPVGTRIERTEEIARQALEGIKEVAGPNNVKMSVAFGGVSPSSYTINTVYLWTAGPEEVVLRVALREHSGVRVEPLRERLRHELPRRLGDWLRREYRAEGLPEGQVEARVKGLSVSFEPADIVNEVMSFGSGTPIEVVVASPDFPATRAHAAKVREQLARIGSLRDLQYVQALDYPTVDVQVDRERAGLSGVTTAEVARSLVSATSSSRFVVPNYWRDPTNGVGYQVQVEIPQARMDSVAEVGMVPIKQTPRGQLLLRDVARIGASTMPGEYDRYNMRRVVSLTANIEGEDLGRVAGRIQKAIAAAGEPPRGVTVDVRGQVTPMRQMLGGLAVGLGMAVVVIFLLLTAYFQSVRLAFIAVTAVPAVLAGVVVALALTGTTLNLQSFMGAIMAVGVAIANAILLITFAERARLAGGDAYAAAVEGGASRLRPILMTSLAMIAGMTPMALALGEGGEQTAPLGRAVIGGLVAATLATLLVLPAVFAVVQRRSSARSVSLDPFDPTSRHYTPLAAQAAHHPDKGVLQESRIEDRGSRIEGRCNPRSSILDPPSCLLLAALAAGCGRNAADEPGPSAAPAVPQVATAPPGRETLRRTIEQPARIQAFERTPIRAKIAGYVQDVKVEIGSRVGKGDLLAELWVPERKEELGQKEAQVTQARIEIRQAEKALAVARANFKTAQSLVEEAVASRRRAGANYERWKSESGRMDDLARQRVIDPQSRDEARNQFRAAEAALDEAGAKVRSAEAGREESAARRDKAEADVEAARNRLELAEAGRRRVRALLDYARITAPFAGVVSDRNVDTGHLLQPASGSAAAAPLFVVERTDRVRVFLEVPEADAVLVREGLPARIRVQALNDAEFEGKVAGCSWSLEPGQRTLRTEIDFDNPAGRLRPGMYAHALVEVEQPDALTLPGAAVLTRDGQTFCCCAAGGKAVYTPLKVGARQGAVVEVLKKQQRPARPGERARWVNFTGKEAIILTNPGELVDGQAIHVTSEP